MSPAREVSAMEAMMHVKVVQCQRKTKHPWEDCIYCHPRENARRRDLTKHRYAAEPCPDYAKDEYCELGDDCPYAHGTFEVHLHPAKYCTKMCTKGSNCTRKICFFAHTESELRDPDYSYGPKNADEANLVKQQLIAERSHHMMSEQQNRQQDLNVLEQWQNAMRQTGGGMNSLPCIPPAYLGSSNTQLPFLGSTAPLSLPLFSPESQNSSASFGPGVFPPAPLDIAAINKENAFLQNLESAGLGSSVRLDDNNMADCQSLNSSPLSSLAMFSRASPQTKSPRSSSIAPRMSVRKARELGIEPEKQHKNGSSPGNRTTSLPPFLTSPPRRSPSKLSTQQPSLVTGADMLTSATRLVSPEGVKLTIDQAIRMVQFIDATKNGSLSVSLEPIDFLTAMTRLKLMGWTTCHVDDHDEGNSSGNSSPDRLSFASTPLAKSFGRGTPSHPMRASFDGSLAVPPQRATLLAGSGLDFSPDRPITGTPSKWLK